MKLLATPVIDPHQTREHRSTSNSIYEEVRRPFSIKPTQLESIIHNVITERNLAARP